MGNHQFHASRKQKQEGEQHLDGPERVWSFCDRCFVIVDSPLIRLASGRFGISITGRISTVPTRAAGNPAGNADGLVQVLGVDQEIAAKLLARLGEGTVRDQPLAVAHAHARSRRDRLQRGGRQVLAVRVELRGRTRSDST